jgi:PAS domain S-box-containing protein
MSRTKTAKFIDFLAALVASSGDAIIGSDLKGTIVFWNKAAEKLFDYSAKEALGQHISIISTPDVSESRLAIFDHVLHRDTICHLEVRYRRRRSEELLISLTISPVNSDNGEARGSSIIARDISNCRKQERQLQQVQVDCELSLEQRQAASTKETKGKLLIRDRLRLTFEVAPTAMILVAQDDYIAMANSQAERLFGYNSRELLGTKMEILVPEFNSLRGEVINAVNAQVAQSKRDLTGMRKDGGRVLIELSLNAVESPGDKLLLVAITDITERVRIRDQLTTAKLETELRNKDLETMLQITSHDLREPLRAIRMFSQMLSERYGERLDEKGRDFLIRIRRGADHLDHLFGDLLSIAQTGRILPSKDWISGTVIVREALIALKSRILETEAHIKVAEDLPNLPVSLIWGTLAIQNLIGNALKFIRDGLHPEIEIEGYSSDSDYGQGIRVSDRGIGVPALYKEQIFELFQRAVGRDIEGTGAGLAIVRQIAERHGGRSWVEKREGGGSHFFVTFGKGYRSIPSADSTRD